MIEIEKDYPTPKTSAGRPKKYPFLKMKIGDSIVVECRESAVRAGYIQFQNKGYKVSFYTKKEGEGYRVWLAKKERAKL